MSPPFLFDISLTDFILGSGAEHNLGNPYKVVQRMGIRHVCDEEDSGHGVEQSLRQQLEPSPRPLELFPRLPGRLLPGRYGQRQVRLFPYKMQLKGLQLREEDGHLRIQYPLDHLRFPPHLFQRVRDLSDHPFSAGRVE